MRSPLRRIAVAVAALSVLAAGCSSTEDEAPAATPTPTPTPAAPTPLTFAVYGPAPVVAAYRKIASTYNAAHPGTVVKVKSYATHDEAMTALRTSRAAGQAPDLFLIDHDDLPALAKDDAVRRVDDLLGEREVDFGDGYYRNGLEAFSSDSALQCMPEDVSPLVVYYNPQLIDLTTVAEEGRNPVSQEDGWNLDEFKAAALQARRPGVRGLYVEPELEQVAPFVWSGGGEIVDDTDEPTTLTLSDDTSRTAMEKLLEIVRDPALTFNEAALQRQSALARFKAGRLGMILGYRDLTPVLRQQRGLTFDVMPMPRLSSGASIASMSGLCVSADSEHVDKTADFLADVVSDPSAQVLAETGYVMPPNLDIVNSDAFLQDGQLPVHSEVFAKEVRATRQVPVSEHWGAVRSAASAGLRDLFYQPVIVPLEDRLAAIDEASKPIFDPSVTPSPTASPSSSPTSTP